MAENKEPQAVLSDEERFPLIKDFSFLKELRQDNAAPVFNFQSGDRLQEKHLQSIFNYEKAFVHREKIKENEVPDFVKNYILESIDKVPFYKGGSNDLQEHVTFSKAAIRQTPWQFICDDADMNDLLVYSTSGTTGPAMDVLFAPETQASWIIQLESIMKEMGISFSKNPERVAIALICNQEKTLTYASLSTYLNGSGVLKINLNKDDWRNEQDRINFLEKYNPEVLTGDPIAFMALKNLNPQLSPKLMVSSAMKLHPKTEKELSTFFNCPVIDVYGMTECRMLAFRTGDVYRSIRPDIYFEVFDSKSDKALPYGEFGELVLTGGNNPFLKLIRYRTGDFGRLELRDGIQCITELEAREPVLFYDEKNNVVNNIDVSRGLMHLDLSAYSLHQNTDRSFEFAGRGDKELEPQVFQKLLELFGSKATITVTIQAEPITKSPQSKIVYTSDVE